MDNGQLTMDNSKRKQVGFVCVHRNGVSQYRGALCRHGYDAIVHSCASEPSLDWGGCCPPLSPRQVMDTLDFSRGFNFPPQTVSTMNRVAAPFHRFGLREVDGVKWWGWWPITTEAQSHREEQIASLPRNDGKAVAVC